MAFTFITPPVCQGQIVEVSYACAGDCMLRRTHDRSDRTTSYARAKISADDWAWYESYHPVNGEPPLTEWTELSAAEVERMEADWND